MQQRLGAVGRSGRTPAGWVCGGRRCCRLPTLRSIAACRFGPVKEKASNTTVLDFEKPLVELDNRIKEVGAPPKARLLHRPRYGQSQGLGARLLAGPAQLQPEAAPCRPLHGGHL